MATQEWKNVSGGTDTWQDFKLACNHRGCILINRRGMEGKSVSHICERIHRATDKAEDKVYSIVCFDEIDKVFRSNRTNYASAADSGFLPLNNLLTFLAGGMITCTDNNSRYSIDSTNFLIICLGAFGEDLKDIIKSV